MKDKNLYSKTFMYLALGLLFTFATGYLVTFNEAMLMNVLSGRFVIVIWILEIILAIFFGRRLPVMSKAEAIICYILYTFLTGITFSSTFVIFSVPTLMFIFLATAVIFGILALIGMNSKKDFMSLGNMLFIGLIIIIVLSLINMFIGSSTIVIILDIIGTFIFLLYTIYDVQTLDILSKINYEVAPIYGAFELYLDFINLFMNLLELFGNDNN